MKQLARKLAPISQKTPAIPNPQIGAGLGVVQSVNADGSVNVLYNNALVPVNVSGTTSPAVGTTVLIMTVGSQWWSLGASLLTSQGGVQTGFAPLDSPNFTGIPTAPTAAPGTDTNQIATTAFVQTAIGGDTGTLLQGAEDNIRTESISQLAPATSSLNMNGQAIYYASRFQANDETAADGAVTLTVNPAAANIYANSGDTQPAAIFGTLFGNGGFALGPGGTTAADTIVYRNTQGALTCLGDAAHGKWTLSSNPASMSLFATTTDTYPYWSAGSLYGQAFFALGPGGSTLADVRLWRIGGGVAQWQLPAGMTWWDGVAADGQVQISMATPRVATFKTYGDTQPISALGSLLGAGAIAFGPGGGTAMDCFLYRTAAGTVTLDADGMTFWDGTSTDGEVTISLASPAVRTYATFGDSQPQAALGEVFGTGALGLGPGGGSALDVFLTRTAGPTAALQATNFNVTDGTAAHGLVSVGFNAPYVKIFSNSADANAQFEAFANIFGSPVVQFGAGGASATDVTLIRNNAGVLSQSVGSFSWTGLGAQTIAAGTTIARGSTHIQITATGIVTNTAHPTIAAGVDGELVVLINTGTNAITLTSNSGSAGTNLSLGAATRAIGAKGSLALMYNSALTRWVEIGFNAGGNG
jgi:hypothetical protein